MTLIQLRSGEDKENENVFKIEHHVFRRTKWRTEKDNSRGFHNVRTKGIPKNIYAKIIANFYNLIGRLHQNINKQNGYVSGKLALDFLRIQSQLERVKEVPLFSWLFTDMFPR